MYSKLNNTYSNSDEYDSEPWKCGDKWKKPPDNWTGTCQNDPQHTIYAQRDDSTNWGICSNASCPQNQEPIIFDDKTKYVIARNSQIMIDYRKFLWGAGFVIDNGGHC